MKTTHKRYLISSTICASLLFSTSILESATVQAQENVAVTSVENNVKASQEYVNKILELSRNIEQLNKVKYGHYNEVVESSPGYALKKLISELISETDIQSKKYSEEEILRIIIKFFEYSPSGRSNYDLPKTIDEVSTYLHLDLKDAIEKGKSNLLKAIEEYPKLTSSIYWLTFDATKNAI